MNRLDLFRMGCNNLLRRKLRTFLTSLGILIGTVSIVVMISLGIAMKANFRSDMESMGNLNVVEVRQGYSESMNGRGEEKKITPDDIEKFKQFSGVEAVTPIFETSAKLVSGKYTTYAQVVGIDTSVIEQFDIEIENGRMMTSEDKNAIIIGQEVQRDFRDSRRDYRYDRRNQDDELKVNVLEDRLMMTFDMSYGEKYASPDSKKVRPTKIICTGIIKGGNWQDDYSVYMDIDALMKQKEYYDKKMGSYNKKTKEGYSKAKVKIKDINNVEKVQEEIKKLGFQASSMLDMIKPMENMTNTIQMIFGGIGAIALLVASIGITNTMIMAIYERRKEIGVMKVIGAQIRDIKKLFLFESAAIGFVGGILGLLASYGASALLNYLGKNISIFGFGGGMGGANKMSVIPPWLAISAVVFTGLIGLISGYLPARKAMKLSALEAIKN